MTIEEVKEVLLKYQDEEKRIDQLLDKIDTDDNTNLHNNFYSNTRRPLSLQEAVTRNKQILKDLETVKGNLRSKAIYSPSEMQWDSITKRYQSNPSLPIISWKCHLPVFV